MYEMKSVKSVIYSELLIEINKKEMKWIMFLLGILILSTFPNYSLFIDVLIFCSFDRH